MPSSAISSHPQICLHGPVPPLPPSHHDTTITRNPRPQLRRLLAHRPRNSTTLHLALRIHNHACIIFEIEVHSIGASPRFRLPHHDRRHDCRRNTLSALPISSHTVGVSVNRNPPPFFLSSGFPFFTVAITISPTPAAGSLFRRAPMPLTEMM
jgi:hypothetical protein